MEKVIVARVTAWALKADGSREPTISKLVEVDAEAFYPPGVATIKFARELGLEPPKWFMGIGALEPDSSRKAKTLPVILRVDDVSEAEFRAHMRATRGEGK